VSGTTATVEFPGVCDRSGGSGLRVTSWSLDGENAVAIDTNGTVSISVLMYAPHNISLSTVTQYSLTLDYGAQASILSITPPSIPGDNYWYDGGTVVTFVGGVNLQGYNVVDWTLDGASPVSVVGFPDFTVTMFMNQPHSLSAYVTLSTASCESEKCPTTSTIDITLQTNSSMPSGLWVDGVYYGKPVTFAWPQGSIHNVTAMEGERRGSVKSYFSGWSGESKSRTPTIMLTVNESGYLSADYSKEYLISLTFTDASGSPLVPQSVAVTGPSGARNLGANLTLWAEPAALYRITSATWMDWNVAMGNHSTFSISQPGSLTFPLAVYTQTIRVADAYNLPLQGATINVTTINGANIFLVTDAQGTAQFKVPIGLFRATVDYLGVNDQIVAASGGDHSYSVSFMLSYPLIATIGTVTAVSGAFVFLMLRKRKVDIQHSMDQS
jgi:plastocyanin